MILKIRRVLLLTLQCTPNNAVQNQKIRKKRKNPTDSLLSVCRANTNTVGALPGTVQYRLSEMQCLRISFKSEK
jgi:hypothetical protein